MKLKAIAAASLVLLLTGCGADLTETAAEIPVQEQTAVQEETAAPVKSEEELNAELEEKRASMSEEEFITYMNTERREELNLPESAVYNPELEEYYDSEAKAWDAEQHHYIPLAHPAGTPAREFHEFDGEIPAEMQAELDTFFAAEEQRMQEDDSLMARSDYVFLDDTPHMRTLTEKTQLPYFDVWAEIAKQDGQYAVLGKYMVWQVLQPQSESYALTFAEQMQEQLTLASEAVRKLGDSITAEDAAGLQETYGYMIAPALEDAGRLDLLQITPDSPCQSAEKLAAYARLFA